MARSLALLAAGSGGADTLHAVRRTAAAVRGRGACSHPDGVCRFVLSALEVFAGDVSAHILHGGCGRPEGACLPVPAAPGESLLRVDWTRCRGDGLCAHIVPELVQRDGQGFPVLAGMPVPPWLERRARQAVEMCPVLALRLETADPAQPAGQPRLGRAARVLRLSLDPIADTVPDLAVSEEWIAEISAEPALPE
jgi:ferredoxin